MLRRASQRREARRVARPIEFSPSPGGSALALGRPEPTGAHGPAPQGPAGQLRLGPVDRAGSAPGGSGETPLAWRIAALAWLTLPVAIGRWLALRGPQRLLMVLGLAAPVLGARSLVGARRRGSMSAPTASADQLSVTAIVTARNEAAVIGNLIADLAAQDLLTTRPDAVELILIDDGSTDGTADIARRAAAEAGIEGILRIERREPGGPRLKSAALAIVPPAACRGDILVHFDADARVGSDYLSTVLRYADSGVVAMTARRLVLPRPGLLAAVQADEIAADAALLEARWAAGGMSDFRGNGTIVRRDLLEAVGGWPTAVTEDVDLATRITTMHGHTVVLARDALIWEEPVGTWAGLWRQRVRWAEGLLRRTFRYAPAVARSPRITSAARLDYVLYAAQLLLPGAILGAWLGVDRHRRPGAGVALVVAYEVFQGMIAWEGLGDAAYWQTPDGRQEAASPSRRAIRSVRAALFHAIWVFTIPRAAWSIATRRAPLAFSKTEHRDSSYGAGRSALRD
jgi:hypothetical protein